MPATPGLPTIGRELVLHRLSHDFAYFSATVSGRPLRPYQLAPAAAILDSVRRRAGLSFTVMFPRQAGKNELSAQIEAFLLHRHRYRGGHLVKAAPTFHPQLRTSIERLRRIVDGAEVLRKTATVEHGHRVRLGRASLTFYSADPAASVVGATANHLLEIDEAQDVDEEQYLRVFRPMGSTANCTVVLYGTALDSTCLLERMRQHHLAMEAIDGVKRHFEVSWREVARHNPAYGQYVRRERERLGEEHPTFLTQYLLQPLDDASTFLTERQRAYLAGDFERLLHPRPGRQYVAGIDLAGEDESRGTDAAVRSLRPRRDSTVVAIAELDWEVLGDVVREPRLRIVELLWWTGRPHHALVEQLLFQLRRWRCRRAVVDATGIGAGVASLLVKALGERVVQPFTFSAPGKSRLAYQLLSAVNGGRLQVYRDDTPERRELFHEAQVARHALRPGGFDHQLNFFVSPEQGHDDMLVALALAVEAAAAQEIRRAEGRAR